MVDSLRRAVTGQFVVFVLDRDAGQAQIREIVVVSVRGAFRLVAQSGREIRWKLLCRHRFKVQLGWFVLRLLRPVSKLLM